MSNTIRRAPKRPRLHKGMVGCTLPLGAQVIIDDLAGTFIGGTRSEVIRFMVISWIADHHAAIQAIAGTRAPDDQP